MCGLKSSNNDPQETKEKNIKNMQKIVLFIEPSDDAWRTPFKAGHLFMNRFSIGEEANFEIVKIFELGKSSEKMAIPNRPEFAGYRKQKGMSLSKLILFIGETITTLGHGSSIFVIFCQFKTIP